ncbi:hypothetical protein AB6A40_005706 [Gnathostoma spinigerum]|uniref:Fork-head domain-containing protein n=1 Tax=Gnathostoma spinigerum TaxID=75299 RepID=A0ABD6ER14_9BILA
MIFNTCQVIRMLHPYYRLRPDQWGWQNSIRHNLSLHDCFVKLPLKQTSASGVVGHFWTVVPEMGDKQTLRRRSRAAARAANRGVSSLTSGSSESVGNNTGGAIRGTSGGSSVTDILTNGSNATAGNAYGVSSGSEANISDQSTSTSPDASSVSSPMANGHQSPNSDVQGALPSLYKPLPSYFSTLNAACKANSMGTFPSNSSLSPGTNKLTSNATNPLMSVLNQSCSLGLEALVNSETYRLYTQQLLNAFVYQQGLMSSLQQLIELAQSVNPALLGLPSAVLADKLPLASGILGNLGGSGQQSAAQLPSEMAAAAALAGSLSPNSMSAAALAMAAASLTPPSSTPQQIPSPGSLNRLQLLNSALQPPVKSEAADSFLF